MKSKLSMKKLLTALVGLMLMATVDAYAISKSKYMVKAMGAFVGQPESVLLDKLGRTDKVQTHKDGTVTYRWGAVSCFINADVRDEVVRSWSISGKWRDCWGQFVGLYHSKWPQQDPEEKMRAWCLENYVDGADEFKCRKYVE